MMSEGQQKRKSKGGRKPKEDRAIFRYSISLTEEENQKFLKLFRQSDMPVMAHFIKACIFQTTVTTVKIDQTTHDFVMRLTSFYSQFRSVGINYNQIVKLFHQHFTVEKATKYLQHLEIHTAEMAELCKKVVDIALQFEAEYLKKQSTK